MAQALTTHATVVSGFVDGLQEPRTPYISPNRLAKALGVPVTGLAELTGVHRNTLRNPFSQRLQGRMREMIKVISAAAELTGAGIETTPFETMIIRRRANWYRKGMSRLFWPMSGILVTTRAGKGYAYRPGGRDFSRLSHTKVGSPSHQRRGCRDRWRSVQ